MFANTIEAEVLPQADNDEKHAQAFVSFHGAVLLSLEDDDEEAVPTLVGTDAALHKS